MTSSFLSVAVAAYFSVAPVNPDLPGLFNKKHVFVQKPISIHNIHRNIGKSVFPYFLNEHETDPSDRQHSVWQRWIVPSMVTIGIGFTVYEIYSIRGR